MEKTISVINDKITILQKSFEKHDNDLSIFKEKSLIKTDDPGFKAIFETRIMVNFM